MIVHCSDKLKTKEDFLTEYTGTCALRATRAKRKPDREKILKYGLL